MAISPPGDIIMDVMRAADPQKLEAARQKLRAKAADATFEVPEAIPSRVSIRNGETRPASEPKAYAQFEAMVLQTFFESILPKEMDTFYGGGLSGDMWRSMLAQELGQALARDGGIGISERILKDHYFIDGKAVPVAGVSSAAEEALQQASLSTAMLQEIERNTTRGLSSESVANQE